MTDYIALARECGAITLRDEGCLLSASQLAAFAARIAQAPGNERVDELLDQMTTYCDESDSVSYGTLSTTLIRMYIKDLSAALSVAPSPDREDALRIDNAGSLLSNIAFNWAQRPGYVLTEHDCEMLGKCSKAWDAARQAPKEPKA